MQINSLTFQTTLSTNGNIAFICPELGICTLPIAKRQDIAYCVEELIEDCEMTLVLLWDAKEIEETPMLLQLLKSIGLEETRQHIQMRRRDWAIERNYPALENHYYRIMGIPGINWDAPERKSFKSQAEFEEVLSNYNQKCYEEKEAWEALICYGKEHPKWIAWMHWITKHSLRRYAKHHRNEVYKRWRKVGLPLLSFKETLS